MQTLAAKSRSMAGSGQRGEKVHWASATEPLQWPVRITNENDLRGISPGTGDPEQ